MAGGCFAVPPALSRCPCSVALTRQVSAVEPRWRRSRDELSAPRLGAGISWGADAAPHHPPSPPLNPPEPPRDLLSQTKTGSGSCVRILPSIPPRSRPSLRPPLGTWKKQLSPYFKELLSSPRAFLATFVFLSSACDGNIIGSGSPSAAGGKGGSRAEITARSIPRF